MLIHIINVVQIVAVFQALVKFNFLNLYLLLELKDLFLQGYQQLATLLDFPSHGSCCLFRGVVFLIQLLDFVCNHVELVFDDVFAAFC